MNHWTFRVLAKQVEIPHWHKRGLQIKGIHCSPILPSSPPGLWLTCHPSHAPYPWFLLQLSHHNNSSWALLPHHPPEVPKGLWQRSLRGNVGILLPVAINVVGINVITAHNSCIKSAKPSQWDVQDRTLCSWKRKICTRKLERISPAKHESLHGLLGWSHCRKTLCKFFPAEVPVLKVWATGRQIISCRIC